MIETPFYRYYSGFGSAEVPGLEDIIEGDYGILEEGMLAAEQVRANQRFQQLESDIWKTVWGPVDAVLSASTLFLLPPNMIVEIREKLVGFIKSLALALARKSRTVRELEAVLSQEYDSYITQAGAVVEAAVKGATGMSVSELYEAVKKNPAAAAKLAGTATGIALVTVLAVYLAYKFLFRAPSITVHVATGASGAGNATSI